MGVVVLFAKICYCFLFWSAALLSCNNNDTTGVFGFGIQHQHQHQQQRSSLSYSYSSTKTPKTVGSINSSGGGKRQTVTALFAQQIPKIDEWTILKSGAVQGTVSNHPELPDGYEITTSPLDPKKGMAKNNVIVVTASGSKYKLLTTIDQATPVKKKGKRASLKIPKPSIVAVAATPIVKKKKKKEKAAVIEVVENLIDFDFNGKVVGNSKTNKIYLLVGKLIRSSSKRSQIYYAYEGETANGKGNNKLNQNRLTVKISSYPQRLERENKNYNTISNKSFVLFAPLKGSDCCFVKKLDYISNCDTSPETKGGIPPGSAALVLESGTQNVRVYLEQGALKGSELRKAAVNIVRCVEATHSSGLVWTDLKAENFVLTAEGDVKGIDLESCVPLKANPEDFSPEACPPEFAQMEKQGVGFEFRCEKSYDIWSLGMLFFELGTGRAYFQGKSEDTITKLLANADPKVGGILDKKTQSLLITDEQKEMIGDNKFLDLIQQCLQYNPKKRPSITQILLHPYFLTTGIGPITF